EYADTVFIPFLQNQLQNASRLDIVWDNYINYVPISLKEIYKRKKKGVSPDKNPGNRMDFLRAEENHKGLFCFLPSKVENFAVTPSKDVYITTKESVVSKCTGILLPSCNHEEGDTRIVVHVLHALKHGGKSIQVKIVDTNVVVILVGNFSELLTTQPLADSGLPL
ncbi:hypothetical protein Hamer_G003204, partial [Homarus americanus]